MCPCRLVGVDVKVRSISVEGLARLYVRGLRHIDVIVRRGDAGVDRLTYRIECCDGHESLCKLRIMDLGAAMTPLHNTECRCD